MKKLAIIAAVAWAVMQMIGNMSGMDIDLDYDPNEEQKYEDRVRGRGDDYNEYRYQAPNRGGDTTTYNYRGRSARTGRFVHRSR